MPVGILTLELSLPGCQSLKEKRRRIKPLISRLQREFNLSVAEMDHLDVWQSAEICCVVVSNNGVHAQKCLQSVVPWMETHRQDIIVLDERFEIL